MSNLKSIALVSCEASIHEGDYSLSSMTLQLTPEREKKKESSSDSFGARLYMHGQLVAKTRYVKRVKKK